MRETLDELLARQAVAEPPPARGAVALDAAVAELCLYGRQLKMQGDALQKWAGELGEAHKYMQTHILEHRASVTGEMADMQQQWSRLEEAIQGEIRQGERQCVPGLRAIVHDMMRGGLTGLRGQILETVEAKVASELAAIRKEVRSEVKRAAAHMYAQRPQSSAGYAYTPDSMPASTPVRRLL